MRLSDYVVNFLVERGVKHTFLVTGGGAMHLNDAFGRHASMQCVPCHHEQACAMAAESYFRMSNAVAAVNVTTGPGGTNALTGVYGAYVDSCAMFLVSGQVKRETLVCTTGLPLRQLGDQEIDIVSVAKSITKYSALILDPRSIRFHLEKAWYLCTSGRPGPVWLDIPVDVQASSIDPDSLEGFIPPVGVDGRSSDLVQSCADLLNRLQKAQRPVVLAGGGVRIAGAYDAFLRFIEKIGIPVTTAWNSHDLLWNEHPLYSGRPGSVGDRGGNFAVQNSDFLLVLGCRLNIRQIGYNWKSFARGASITMVDVDEAELQKPTLRIEYPILADLGEFLSCTLSMPYEGATQAHRVFLDWCRERCVRYPVVRPEYRTVATRVNPYVLMAELFAQLEEGQWVVSGDGTACVAAFQAAEMRRGQRLYTNSGCASMGYDLPAAIGASLSGDRRKVVCITGDGSIQMNLQELQTIRTQRLAVKIFLLNNEGYHSIRQTQNAYFPDCTVGCGPESGLEFPDFRKIAEAYHLPYFSAATHDELPQVIRQALAVDGATFTEVHIDMAQAFSPKLSSRKLPDGRMVSAPLEDLAPFLSRDELRSNMLIPLWEEPAV